MKTLLNENAKKYNGTSKSVRPHLISASINNEVSKQEDYFGEILYPTLSIKFISQLKRIIWMWILSPLVLLDSLLIYALVPSKIFKEGIKQFSSNMFNEYFKRLFDILGSIIGLILSSVVFLIVPILIKLDSKGPVFYTQLRVGQNRRKKIRRNISTDIYRERRDEDRRKDNIYGKPFYIYKFRTMREDAEKKSGPIWAIDNDPRITTVGKFLRKTHIDEIPQLINIIKGEMSFVGPRPERPYFVYKFKDQIPRYIERLNAKPGLTGLAQLIIGYDQSIESVKSKVKYDLQYSSNGTILSYFKIVLLTIYEVSPRIIKNKFKKLSSKIKLM